MMIAGKHLKSDRLHSGKIGAWNAGIVSWFSQKKIINLDGLVNDNIYPYLVENDLLSYVKNNKIKYLIDYKAMLINEKLKKRGGYSCFDIEVLFIQVKTFHYEHLLLSSAL
jgi:hypothetical protein